MSIEEKYKRKNADVQQQIRSEIENAEREISKKNPAQLSAILEELEKTLNNKCLPLSYPRMIIDSWDFQDKLGMELLDLAELYKRWE
ncbi:MAG: hypothetical protein NC092_13245 [Butyrivibrio sp.]|nr:hypothetical protein [Muribaculum sp.]MCM1553637.1 hypothetical protein [Butyrivibrio sp.]